MCHMIKCDKKSLKFLQSLDQTPRERVAGKSVTDIVGPKGA